LKRSGPESVASVYAGEAFTGEPPQSNVITLHNFWQSKTGAWCAIFRAGKPNRAKSRAQRASRMSAFGSAPEGADHQWRRLPPLSALFVTARNSTRGRVRIARRDDPAFAHVCLRKLGSISIDGGVASLMNTGRSVCDLNRHTSSLFNTHSLIKSATIIGGFD
jgi:hypothetical protein